MSLCYADALSPYENKGKVGMPEISDSPEETLRKINCLADMLSKSKSCVVVAGAGISTSAGIADFRGPNGVWTMEKDGKTALSVDFASARPTLTHMALVALERRGKMKYLVSQNVDGLTVKSGFPLNRLAELHGNVYCEFCERCGRKYYRDEPVGTVGLKHTGRRCEGTPKGRSCRGYLKDYVLDWEDALPEPEYSTAIKYCKEADFILCLGTSLQIVPVGNFPLYARRRGLPFATVNLQATKHEKTANLAIHAPVDLVMKAVLERLEIPEIPFNKIGIVPESIHPLETFEGRTNNKAKERKRKVKKEEEEELEEKPTVPSCSVPCKTREVEAELERRPVTDEIMQDRVEEVDEEPCLAAADFFARQEEESSESE